MTAEPCPPVGPLPLDGVSVMDLTMNVSGPYATMILGDLGADVLKIERPDGGDETRRWAPVHDDGSAYYYSVNRNKRSVTLDVRDDTALMRLRAAITEADVFVTNMRTRKLTALGLDYDSLHDLSPRLVYADISGYGNEGPDADRPGYDMVLQARSGLMSVTGEEGRPPVRVGVSILDMGSGLWLALDVPLPGLEGAGRTSLRQPRLPIRLSHQRLPVRYGPPSLERAGEAVGGGR
jgi:formyl-CoA transferase